VSALEAKDIGLSRFRTSLHVFVAVCAGLLIGAGIGSAFGLPAIAGAMMGALAGFLCCLMISDERAGREAARSAVLVVPMVVGLVLSIELREFRVLELALLVVVLFLQLFAARFGSWGNDAGAGFFAAYLCGLLLPLPSGAIVPLVAIVSASLGFTILLRLTVLRPHARRALFRARRGFVTLTRQVLVASADRMEAVDAGEVHRVDRRLDRAVSRMQSAALLADGLISKDGSGATGDVARDLNRVLFDTELAVETIARSAAQVSTTRADIRALTAAAVRRLAGQGGLHGAQIAADLGADAESIAREEDRGIVRRVADSIGWHGMAAAEWGRIRSRPAAESSVPFVSTITITGGRIPGAASVFAAAVDEDGLAGPWKRVKVSLATRTAIQGLIAVLIVEPLGLLISGDRFYWAVIGIVVVLSGTNSTYERARKTVWRLWGTVVGGVVGIPLALFAGPAHPTLALAIILVSIPVGVYFIIVRYWVWVACLVVLLCQLYALSGQFDQTTVPLRLVENGVGAIVAVIVSFFVFPIGAGSVRRAAVRHTLESVASFVGLLDPAVSPVEADLRSQARLVDLDAHRLGEVFNPLGGMAPSRLQRDALVRASLDTAAYIISGIAGQPAAPRSLPASDLEQLGALSQELQATTAMLIDSIGARTQPATPRCGGDADEGFPSDDPWVQHRLTLMRRLSAVLDDLDSTIHQPRTPVAA
jgi:uncharacterized membrane protein YccC